MLRISNGLNPIIGTALLLLGAGLAAQDEPAPSTSDNTTQSEARLLDLRPPDITDLYTREQIDQLLAKTRDSNIEQQNIEEAEVEGNRDVPLPTTPEVWPVIFAPFWAILNPQAWRIFAPLPPDQTRGMENERDFTDTDPEPATSRR